MKRYISHIVFALLGCMVLSACVDNDYMELDKGHTMSWRFPPATRKSF